MIQTFPTYPDLASKVTLVTGGAHGIGATTCQLLGANGATVVVNDRDPVMVNAVVAEIRSCGGRALGLIADCTNFVAVDDMRRQIEQEAGPVDVLVAFAGGLEREMPIGPTPEEQQHLVIDATLTATFLSLTSFLPGMIERRRGSIVTMAPNAARVTAVGASAVTFSRRMAREVGRYGVRVNCVASAPDTTGVPYSVSGAGRDETATGHLGLLRTPEDVARTTLFLASDSSFWLSGVILGMPTGSGADTSQFRPVSRSRWPATVSPRDAMGRWLDETRFSDQ